MTPELEDDGFTTVAKGADMVDATSAENAQVDVTQADREAAASVWSPIPGGKHIARAIERGDIDSDPRVQAFARHRLASTEALRAQLAEREAEIAAERARADGLVEALKSTQATLSAIRAQVHSEDCADHIYQLAGRQMAENAEALGKLSEVRS